MLALKSTAVFLQMGVGVRASLFPSAGWVMSLQHVHTVARCGAFSSQNSEKTNKKESNLFAWMEAKLDESKRVFDFEEALPSSFGQVTSNSVGRIRKKRKEGMCSSVELFFCPEWLWSRQAVCRRRHTGKNNWKNNTLKHVLGTESLEKQFSKYFSISSNPMA